MELTAGAGRQAMSFAGGKKLAGFATSYANSGSSRRARTASFFRYRNPTLACILDFPCQRILRSLPITLSMFALPQISKGSTQVKQVTAM